MKTHRGLIEVCSLVQPSLYGVVVVFDEVFGEQASTWEI